MGNEVWDNEHRHSEFHEEEEFDEFPKAEARRQSEENQPHVKILSDSGHKNEKLKFRKLEHDEKKSSMQKENVKSTKGEIYSQVRMRNRL